MKRIMHKDLLIALLLIAGALLLYYPSLSSEFVFDDEIVIVANRFIRSPDNLPGFFLRPTYSFYRPLRSLSYLLDYRCWELNPFGFHFTSILLHGLCCFAFYLLLKSCRISLPVRAMAAVLFLVHPVNTEAVVYLSSRAELLGTLFALLFFLAAGRYISSGRARTALLALFFLAGALLSKESFAVLPLLFLLFRPGHRPATSPVQNNIRRHLRITLCSLLLAGGFLVFRFFLLAAPADLGQFGRLLTYPQIMIKIPEALITYLRLLILPFNLSPHHPLAVEPLLAPPAVLLQVTALVGVILLIFSRRKSSPVVFRSGLWILIALIPISNIYPLPRLLAEKRLYLPSLGFSLLVAELCCGRYHRSGRSGYRLFWIIVAIFTLLTLLRQPVWRSNYALWERTSRDRPRAPLTLYNWGMARIQAGREEEGLADLRAAEMILPGQPVILERIADCLGLLGRYRESLEVYQKLLRDSPDSPSLYLKIGFSYEGSGYSRLAEHYYNEALALASRTDPGRTYQFRSSYLELAGLREAGGDTSRAVRLLEDLLSLTPGDPAVHYRLGFLYEKEGRFDDALEQYRRALENGLSSSELLYRQGRAYQGAGQFKKAMQSYHHALRRDPDLAPAYFDLGSLLAGYKEYEPAEKLFRAGLKRQPDNYRARTNLGSIYQFQQKYPEAIAEYERSLQIEDSYKARYNLGFLYLNKLDQPKKALPHLKEALRRAINSTQKKKIEDALSQINTE